jgi:hypothetical protein
VLIAGFSAWLIWSGSSASTGGRARFSVGADGFDFDRRYLQPGREDGVVELAAFFPDFSPAGETADVNVQTDIADRFRRTIVIELRPADPQIDPNDRTTRLYLRFLSDVASNESEGLVTRIFDASSPFAGDELHYTPPEGRPFAARCRRAESPSKPPQLCFAAFRSGHVDAQIRFSATLLPDWSALMKGAAKLLDEGRR